MKGFIGEYGKTIIYTVVSTILMGMVWFVMNTQFAQNITEQLTSVDTPRATTNSPYITEKRPTLLVKESIKLNTGDTFDIINTPSVVATDGTTKANIVDKVLVYGNVGTTTFNGSDWKSKRNIKATKEGVFYLRYSIRDSKGFYKSEKVRVLVEPII